MGWDALVPGLTSSFAKATLERRELITEISCVCMCAKLLPSCPALCDPMDCSLGLPRWLSGKRIHLQCRRCGFDPWVRRSPGGGQDNPLQYSSLENPMDRGAWQTTVCVCSVMSNSLQPHGRGSSVHGILQARILEWVAISFSRGSSPPRDGTWVCCIAGGPFTI